MSYRDELKAAEARVKSLETELAEARETRDELADKAAEPEPAPKKPKPKQDSKRKPPLKVWLIRAAGIAGVVGVITGIVTLNRYCNNAPVRELDSQTGNVVHTEILDGQRVLVITKQHAYDDGTRLADRRIAIIDLGTGTVSRSRRLVGGRGGDGNSFKFHGRHGELLWFENSVHSLHARDLSGSIAIDREQVKSRLPAIKRVGLVVSADGLHVGGDDGYWYRVGESAEAVRVPRKPATLPRGQQRQNCSARVSVAQHPDSPNKRIILNDVAVANTESLEITWLAPAYDCPIGDPPGFLFKSRSRVNGPQSVRMVGIDGVVRWESRELGSLTNNSQLQIVDDHLIALPNRGTAFSASLVTGKIRWRVRPDQL